MCGICGWFGEAPAAPQALFATQSKLLHHRGPDDAGLNYGPGWGLGFRRLSILDLSPLGHQPMSCDDGRFWLAFNGEIYNYVELRQALEKRGAVFCSGSDTEVLLRLLVQEGVAALPALNGMFALAFVDTQARTFLLARDRMGKKPLYYQQDAQHLRFASELKALLAWPGAERQLNPQAVAEYLAYGYLPTETCIFHSYQKLPAAHYLHGKLDAPADATPQAYWQIEINPEEHGKALIKAEIDRLGEILDDATRIRLRSDVPVGVFLSGGLDSGLVATLAARTASTTKPLVLTVGFAEEEYDETDLAQAVSQRWGLDHRVIRQEPGDLMDIDRLAWFYDEPFGDPSALPTMALCAAAAQHATVFLSGDGGDEAFGGYRRYIESQNHRWLAHLPSSVQTCMRTVSRVLPRMSALRYRLTKVSLPDAGFAAAFDGVPNDPILYTLLSQDLRLYAANADKSLWRYWTNSRGRHLTARQQLFDYAMYLPDDILVKVDRASMAHSIEVRSPFLDYRLVEWAASLPRAALVNSNTGKLPLRALGKQLLPPTVQRAAKRGFGVPLTAWFRQPSGLAFVQARLLSAEARQRNLWDVDNVATVIQQHQSVQNRDFGQWLWRLLMLDAWARLYLDSSNFLQGPTQK